VTLAIAAAVGSALAAWLWVPAACRRGVLAGERGRRRWRPPVPHRPTPRAHDVATLAAALASELRAGRTPDEAWLAVVGEPAQRLPASALPGSEPARVLERWARSPGWGGLLPVATCWRLADASGGGLADALDRVAVAMRHEHEVGDEVSGQLAAVRATAWVLATVPVLAVVLGQMVGADPLAVLLGTPLGVLCLVLGSSLAAAGWWWLTRQVESVRRTLRW
jgi:tight adherence protein B